MNVTDIAKVTHEVNRIYCQAIGDDSQASWEAAPEWQKVSIVKGVKFHLANPDALPSAGHSNWMAEKVREAWRYGEVKDVDNKTHPCMVHFEQLPLEQQVKDYLFKQIVNSLAEHVK